MSDHEWKRDEEGFLRCPVCGFDQIKVVMDRVECQNLSCNATFPIVDGCPILLNEAKSVFRFSDFTSRRDTYFRRRNKWIVAINSMLPSTSHNIASVANYRKILRELSEISGEKRVLVVGSGDVGAGIELLLKANNLKIIETDVALGKRVSYVCDGHDLPFQSEIFDLVIVQAVLEHVLDPYRCVDEILRVLKTGGLVYSETPFMQQVHGGAFDFTRFTARGHRRLFKDFEQVAAGMAGGPGMALAWSWQYFLSSFSGRSVVARQILALIGRMSSFYLKYFDYLFVHSDSSSDAASSFYFMGRKGVSSFSDLDLIYGYSLKQGAK